MNQTVRAPLAGALTLVLATTIVTATAPIGIVVVSAVIVALLSIGWPALLELPSPRGSSFIIAMSGFGALALAVTTQGHMQFSSMLITVIAAAIFASFVQEMFRTQRERLTVSISGTASGALLSALTASWLQAHAIASWTSPTAMTLLACLTFASAAGLLALALPFSAQIRIPITILTAGLTGSGIAIATSLPWVLVGIIAGTSMLLIVTAISVFFLAERVIGAYDTAPFLALSTAALPLLGLLSAVCVRLCVAFVPDALDIAVIPMALRA